MTCETSGTVGGAGCMLAPDHSGDHDDLDGSTWPQLVERDCPTCGALMHITPSAPSSVECWACQDEKAGPLPSLVAPV